MKKFEIVKDFIIKSIFPALFAVLLYNLFVNACMTNGAVNYMYLLMLCGIPFGIRFMFTLPIFAGNMGFGIAMICFNIAIGAIIGGIILVWKLLVAVWYVPLTVIRFITEHNTQYC